LEQGRNFNNKIWNALKLIKMWEGRQLAGDNGQSADNNFAIEWFDAKLNEARTSIIGMMAQFRLSEALKTIYSLIWDDFCSWYLEWIKPGFEQPIDPLLYHKTIGFFEELMQLLHPFMPFVTEEVYHLLRAQSDDLCVKQAAEMCPPDAVVLRAGELSKQVITAIRDARNKNQLKPKEAIELFIQTSDAANYRNIESMLEKQLNATAIAYCDEAVSNTIVVAVEKDKFYIKTEKELNTGNLKDDLLKDLAHQKGFLASVEKKLSNERFVQNAKPEVLAMEQKKKADAEARIKTIEESLSTIS